MDTQYCRKQQHCQGGVYVVLNSKHSSLWFSNSDLDTRSELLFGDDFTVFCTMTGSEGIRYVSRDERRAERKRRAGIEIASFIIRLPVISPTPVILHDLGGFSLRSKALRDKTLQIEFDSYHLLCSACDSVTYVYVDFGYIPTVYRIFETLLSYLSINTVCFNFPFFLPQF